jgi:hypothetical protein
LAGGKVKLRSTNWKLADGNPPEPTADPPGQSSNLVLNGTNYQLSSANESLADGFSTAPGFNVIE